LVAEKEEVLKKVITNIHQNLKNIGVKENNMNNKAAKKLRRLSVALAAGAGKTLNDAERIYRNLKVVYKENKKAPNRG